MDGDVHGFLSTQQQRGKGPCERVSKFTSPEEVAGIKILLLVLFGYIYYLPAANGKVLFAALPWNS